MTPYTPDDLFNDVSIYDTNDPVLGGTGGESNEPIKALADRTQYLFNRLGSFLGQRIITATGTITIADVFKLLKVVTASNVTLTLDPVAGFAVGAMIKVKAKITATANTGKAVGIVPNGAENIEDGNINVNTAGLFLHDGEEITLVAGDADNDDVADHWIMIEPKGNFEKVGKDDLVRIHPRNSFIAQGGLSNRADFPRVWAAVSASAISDATWGTDIRFQGFFSTGNGSTTFRWPDMRSMVAKGLDMGRGISLGRLDNVEGGLELDAILSHNHQTKVGGSNTPDPVAAFRKSNISDGYTTGKDFIGNTGGPENLIKTIGFTPVIYY